MACPRDLEARPEVDQDVLEAENPPLRKPDLLKSLAGPEIEGGNFLSDASPEEQAAELRALPSVHQRQTEVP